MATAVAPLIAVVVLGAAALALALQRRWQHRLVGTTRGLGGSTERTDILYFTGVNCTVCHVAQRPALARLRELIGDVAIREVDVAVEREVASAYRVMTLPTTVVLDPKGRMTAVNPGFATETLLHDQVRAARAASREPSAA